MSSLEEVLKKHTVSTGVPIPEIETAELLDPHHLALFGNGIFNRVYTFREEPWILKEGRWDIELPLTNNIILPVPAKTLNAGLRKLSGEFLPTREEIERQHDVYIRAAKFLGVGALDQDLAKKQIELRNALANSIEQIEQHYKFSLPKNLPKLLTTNLRFHNFLPKEYIAIGTSIAPANKERKTSLIFQEFISGNPLYKVDLPTQPENIQHQMILFALLTLFMAKEENILPDTRPYTLLGAGADWLTKTDNIVVSEEGLRFVDTRWHWETRPKSIRRGIIIAPLIIRSAQRILRTARL